MKRDRVNVIIRKAYAERYGLTPEVVYPRHSRSLSRIYPVFAGAHPIEFVSQRRVVISIALFVVLIVGITAYYYNGLVRAQQDMLTAIGHVNALLQRRHDTAVNMSKAVLDYARHERILLNEVTRLRSQKNEPILKAETEPGGTGANSHALRSPEMEQLIKQWEEIEAARAPSGSQGQSVPKEIAQKDGLLLALTTLSALAEQYPDLKLSASFQNMMNALNEWEKALAEERIRCNDKINVYTTKRAVFPSNLFARLFGFPDQEYFDAEKAAKGFVLIDY